MYVCLCQRITDSAIKESVRKGASSLTEVQQQLGIARKCGSCTQMAEQIIQDTLGQDAHLLPYAAA